MKTALDIVNESFEKQASIASAVKGAKGSAVKAIKRTGLGSAVDDYMSTSRNLDSMKGLAIDGAKAGNKSYTQIAGDGINHLETRKRLAGKQVKHEARKLPGKAADFAKNNKGLTAGAAIAGAAAVANGRKQEKTALDIVNEAFEKQAGIASKLKGAKDIITGANIKKAKGIAAESAKALGNEIGKGRKALDGASDYAKHQLKSEKAKTGLARTAIGAGAAAAAGVAKKQKEKKED